MSDDAFYICDACGKRNACKNGKVPICPCQKKVISLSDVLLPLTGTVSFTVPGQPVPKARPRLGKGKAYTPKKTKHYQSAVALIARQKISSMYQTELFMHLKFYREIQRGKKPDVDNLAKSVMDALEGIAYTNDDLIRKLYIEVDYIRENPRCEVFIAPISNTDAINERLLAA